MKKLVLTLAILISAWSLYGMDPTPLYELRRTGVERQPDRRVKQSLCTAFVSPITLPQTYHQLSEILPLDITRHIFSLQLNNSGIDLANLPLKIEQSCRDSDELIQFIKTLIESCDHNLAVELFKRFSPHENKSMCNIKNKSDWTALHLAIEKRDIKVVKFLLHAAGNDVWALLTARIEGYYDFTALHLIPEIIGQYGYRENIYTDTVKLLLHAADKNIWALLTMKTVKGQTTLHVAAHNDCIEIIKLLLHAAGDKAQDLIAIKSYNGFTAFDLATPQVQEVMKTYFPKSTKPDCVLF